MQRFGIDDVHLFGQRRLAGQGQRLGDKSRITATEQYPACRFNDCGRPFSRFTACHARRVSEDQLPELASALSLAVNGMGA